MVPVNLRRDPSAASPLVVILTVVLVVVGLTSLGWFLFGGEPASMEVQLVDQDGVRAFQVTRTGDADTWGDLEVRFITPSGTDRADLYLDVPAPDIPVRPGDQIPFAKTPPAGTYLLQIFEDGEERLRFSVPLD